MRVIVTQYKSEAPSKGPYQKGKDFTEYEDEFDEEEAILLLRRLRPSRSYILLKGKNYGVEVHFDRDCLINVEITSLTDAFWAISEVCESEAESIIKMTYRGEDFAEFVPGTDRKWDAWGPSD